MKSFALIITGICIAFAIAFVGALFAIESKEYRSYLEDELKVQAVQDCFNSSEVVYTNERDGVTTRDVIKETYVLCLKDKGYSTAYRE